MRYISILVAIVITGLLAWLLLNRLSRSHATADTVTVKPTNAAPELVTNEEAEKSPHVTEAMSPASNIPFVPQPGQTELSTRAEWEKRMIELVFQGLQQTQWEWKMPIEFYGKVVDQNGDPVSGVQAHMIWTDISDAGTSETNLVSDAEGLFSLTGVSGKRLQVWLQKEGYYVSKSNRIGFEYARDYEAEYHRPDKANPVLFHVRKKGPGTELVTSQYGVFPELEVKAPRDGSPVRVDFFTRTVGNTGPLEISQIKPAYERWKQATAWSFRMAIPDGGFVEHGDEFPFEAPEHGYRQVVEFNFDRRLPNWTTRVSRDYYIVFGNPPRYGRMTVKTTISSGMILLEYAINPDGSRYLEPKEPQPAKRALPPGVIEIVPGQPQ